MRTEQEAREHLKSFRALFGKGAGVKFENDISTARQRLKYVLYNDVTRDDIMANPESYDLKDVVWPDAKMFVSSTIAPELDCWVDVTFELRLRLTPR